MVWAVIGIVVAIMAVAIYFALKAHNKLVAEGKIISRRTDFMENAEEFTLAAVDPSQVTEGVKAFDYNGMRVAMKGSSENQAFRFTGNNWGARLFRVSAAKHNAYIVLNSQTGRQTDRWQKAQWE